MQTSLFITEPILKKPVAPVEREISPDAGWSVYQVYTQSSDGWSSEMREIIAPSTRELIKNLPGVQWTRIVDKVSGDSLTPADYQRMIEYEERYRYVPADHIEGMLTKQD